LLAATARWARFLSALHRETETLPRLPESWQDEVAQKVGAGFADCNKLSALIAAVFNPTTADHDVSIIENGGLAGSNRALRHVKGNSDFIRPG
jgi:hypothetical protein